jgi:hypothetical protein
MQFYFYKKHEAGMIILNRYSCSWLLILFALVTFSCEKYYADQENITGFSDDTLLYNPTWTFQSHGKSHPDYSIVFSQDSVKSLFIKITSSQWNSIRSNMKSIVGFDFGANSRGGAKIPEEECDYVDVQVEFNGKTWKNVGFRLKGNSSLSMAWGEGNYKLPFRLSFDKFEDSYAAISEQHFYGFRELSFSPGCKDQSLMREKLTADIFRLAGVPAARTSFYRVYIDFGSGIRNCGVYTLVEIPDDTMINDQFGEVSGNIYKPESKLGSFLNSEFEKKNNETENNYSDVISFVDALNSDLRISNAELWRKNLETVFDADHFLRYLAVNNTIVNWDSYGKMAHNYYLFNHSERKLVWIPWDHNEALSGSPGITGTSSASDQTPPGFPGGAGAPGGDHTGFSLAMNEISSEWPLVNYLVNDTAYMAAYKSYLKWFADEVFTEEKIIPLIEKYYSMISPFAIGAEGEKVSYTYLSGDESFVNASFELKSHISNRRALIKSYVP